MRICIFWHPQTVTSSVFVSDRYHNEVSRIEAREHCCGAHPPESGDLQGSNRKSSEPNGKTCLVHNICNKRAQTCAALPDLHAGAPTGSSRDMICDIMQDEVGPTRMCETMLLTVWISTRGTRAP